MFRWIALISAIALVVAVAGAIVSSQPPIEPSQEQSATKNQGKYIAEKYDVTLWDRWFPDSISLYTLFLVVFTAVLAIGGVYQFKFLGRAEQIAANTPKPPNNPPT